MKLPDGFTPVTFAAFDAQHPEMLPEVLASLLGDVRPDSIVEGRAVIAKMADVGVLQFASAASGEPAAFAASDAMVDASLAVPSTVNLTAQEIQFGKRLVAAVVKWFGRSGEFDAKTGTIVDDAHPLPPGHFAVPVTQWLLDSSIDANRIAQQARLSRHVAAACFLRLEQAGYLRIQRKIGRQRGEADALLLTVPDARDLSRSERALAEAMNDIFPMETNGRITFNDGPVRWPKEETQVRQIQTVRTPTGTLAIIRPMAERLLAEGVISGTIDGDLHAADAATLKAALMASAVCDFCSSPGAAHYFDVPDFGITKNDDPNNYGAAKSTGGWMACDACDELIRKNRRKQLVDRAVENMAFPKFSRRAIEELYAKFWQGMDERVEAFGLAKAVAEFVDDKMLGARPAPAMSARDKRVEATSRMTGLTPDEVECASGGHLSRDVVAKLVRWRKQFGVTDPAEMIDLLASGAGPHRPLADVVPHWQRALDMKFKSFARLTDRSWNETHLPEATDLNDPTAVAAAVRRSQERSRYIAEQYMADAKALRVAQAYSFNADTIAAIREAARSVPRDAPLSSIETPNVGAGWFWFSTPLPMSIDVEVYEQPGQAWRFDTVCALLWYWTDQHAPTPSITFSVYVPSKGDVPIPALTWSWPFTMSVGELTADVSSRGPGKETLSPDKAAIVEAMSLFFIMACLWFRQTVPATGRKIEPKLTRENGSVERQVRKRLAKEHALPDLPTVQVVALRKSQRTAVEDAPAERQSGARDYHCRWIVQGHPRMQACGPGRKDRKLIWIDAHVAGPEGKPLRTRERVYAVVR